MVPRSRRVLLVEDLNKSFLVVSYEIFNHQIAVLPRTERVSLYSRSSPTWCTLEFVAGCTGSVLLQGRHSFHMKVALLLFNQLCFSLPDGVDSPRGHRERRREDTSSATLSRKRKASVPDGRRQQCPLDELSVPSAHMGGLCSAAGEGISSLKKLFDAVLATCRDQIRTGLPGVVIAVP